MKLALLLALVAQAACGAAPPPKPPPPHDLPLNHAGTMVDLAAVLDPGFVTIVDFWSESCGACVVVGDQVTAKIANEPQVLFRRIDVGDGFTQVAHTYDISALPHYNIYDRKKRLRYILVANDCLRAPELARALLAEPL